MPFGQTIRTTAAVLASPILGAMLAQLLGQLTPYMADGGVLETTFSAVGQYWLFVAIFSGIIAVAGSAVAEGGR